VKMLANPVLLRAAVVLFCAAFSFLLGLLFVRLLRKSISDEAEVSSDAMPGYEAMPMHVYNTVIQQLKQQKVELQAQSQSEQQRARVAEAIGQAIVANVSSGVLTFGMNGLVKASNPAAKEILGYASATGMAVQDIFRDAVVSDNASGVADEVISDEAVEPVWLADEVSAVLKEGGERRGAKAEYETPAGVKRHLVVTISAVSLADGSRVGVACLMDDVSEVVQLRGSQENSSAATRSVAAGSAD
jgi:nitrogen fixation/metabolism regulation signal transduction histidine kinase